MEKLKILTIANDYRPSMGGVASCTYELMRAMSRRDDVEVRVLARKTSGADEFDKEVPYATIRSHISANSSLATMQFAAEVAKQTLLWKPDAVFCPLWLPGGAASLASTPARLVRGTPYFCMAHGVEVLETDRNLKKRVRKHFSFLKEAVFKNAAKTFAVSRYTKELVENYCGVGADDIMVVNNGVDIEAFQPKAPPSDLIKKYGLQNRRILLTISRLEDYKGIDRVISALRSVKLMIPNLIYLICGDGPDRGRLEKLTRHYRVQENVIFTGAIPFERRADYYNLAECFILLSRSDLEFPNVEGFGLVFLEAAACAKPSIGGDSGGIPDAVENERTGWLVDPFNDRAIAAKISDCFADPSQTKILGAAARQRAETKLTWGHGADKILAEIRKHVRD